MICKHEIFMQESGLMEKQHLQCSQSSFFTECIVLSKRSFVNMYRDLGYYWLRFAIYIALGIGLGTVFFDIGSTYNSIHVSINDVFCLNKSKSLN